MKRRDFLNRIPHVVAAGMVPVAATVAADAAHAQDQATGGRAARRAVTLNVLDFGARGDGAGDNSPMIQRAIDHAESIGGAEIEFPPGVYRCAGLVLKKGVSLRGLRSLSILKASRPGTILMLPDTTRQVSVVGLRFEGISERSPSIGLVVDGISNLISQCEFDGFADEGIILRGLVHHLEYVFADNCLRRSPRPSVSGALTVEAHDCTLFCVEIAGGLGTRLGQELEPGNNNWCILIKGANTFMTDCVAEVGQGGIRLAASAQQSRVENTRSDLHARDGWFIEGARNQFSNCIALNCGLAGSEAPAKSRGWPAWSVRVGAQNTLTNCRHHHEGYGGNTSFGFEEFGDNPGKEGNLVQNNLIGCTSFGHTRGPFKMRTAGPVLGNNRHYTADWLESGEEIDVYNLGVLELRSQTPNVIRNFKGVSGQRLVVIGDGSDRSTLQHGPWIRMKGEKDLVVGQGRAYEFVNVGDVWYQLA